MTNLRTKQCSRCKELKLLAEFHRRKTDAERRQSICIACMVPYKTTYNQVNKERVRATNAAWMDKNRENHRAWYRRWTSSKEHRANMMVLRAKERAKKKGLPFNITEEDLVIPDRCPVLGMTLDYGFKNTGKLMPNSPSLDRRIPELGYVKGNVQVISAKANWIKSNATPEELMRVALYFGMIS